MESIKESDTASTTSSAGAFRKRTASTKSLASHRRRATDEPTLQASSDGTQPASTSSSAPLRRNNNVTGGSQASKGVAAVPTRQTPITGSEKWLLANYEPSANITTLSTTIELANLAGDGDYRLLIGTLGITKQNKQSHLRVSLTYLLQCLI